jgi:L-2,4-diaminobutyrate transaminase
MPCPPTDAESVDRRSLLHPLTNLRQYAAGGTPHRIIEHADGVRVVDSRGRAVIDGFSGLYCVNVGYGRQELVDAMTAQASTLAFYHVFAGATHPPAIALSQRLLDLAGPRMQRVFFGLSGSDANDTQVKLVWYYWNVRGQPRKKKIIARQRAYHGATVMGASPCITAPSICPCPWCATPLQPIHSGVARKIPRCSRNAARQTSTR